MRIKRAARSTRRRPADAARRRSRLRNVPALAADEPVAAPAAARASLGAEFHLSDVLQTTSVTTRARRRDCLGFSFTRFQQIGLTRRQQQAPYRGSRPARDRRGWLQPGQPAARGPRYAELSCGRGPSPATIDIPQGSRPSCYGLTCVNIDARILAAPATFGIVERLEIWCKAEV